MAHQYRVKAPVVKVSIGSLDGNRIARILRAGAIVPDGVAAESLEKLVDRGFLEQIDVPEDLPPIPAVSPANTGQPPADPSGNGGGPKAAVAVPPKAGQGSSAEAWRTYAAAVEVEVPADASRDDVIAAVEAAGKPTE